MLKKLNWQAFSNGDRAKVIGKVKDIISVNDGCIMNFNIFSDLALSLSIEIEEKCIPRLYKALCSVVSLSEFDIQDINTSSQKEWIIFMNISFGSGEGNLKQEIPEVPG